MNWENYVKLLYKMNKESGCHPSTTHPEYYADQSELDKPNSDTSPAQ